MSTSLLSDGFAHHIWANERVLDACAALTPEQMSTPVPGTYGSIMETLRHLVRSDEWYLLFLRLEEPAPVDEEGWAAIKEIYQQMGLAELRSANEKNGAAWTDVLARDLDPDQDITEIDDGWEVHSPVGVRLAQVIHHGTDHRSQVCTALTSLGLEPPMIDVWAYARATGRERAVELSEK
jgi:uncharacterized damage-inducible protein DinB